VDACCGICGVFSPQPDLLLNTRGRHGEKAGLWSFWIILGAHSDSKEKRQRLPRPTRRGAVASGITRARLRASCLVEAKRYDESPGGRCGRRCFWARLSPRAWGPRALVIAHKASLVPRAERWRRYSPSTARNTWAWHRRRSGTVISRISDYRGSARDGGALSALPGAIEFLADAALRTDDLPRARKLL